MLSDRLLKIYELSGNGECLADVGTDHAFIPIEAVKNGKFKRAIAGDISQGSYKKADKNIRFSGLSDKISARCGAGLDIISTGEADTIVIAGMGGLLIADILKSGYEKIGSARLILQPMTAVSDLRRALCENGFSIENEALVKEDRRIYTVIVAKIGQMGDYDCEVGDKLIENHDTLLPELINGKISNLNKILENLDKGHKDYQKHQKTIEILNRGLIKYES